MGNSSLNNNRNRAGHYFYISRVLLPPRCKLGSSHDTKSLAHFSRLAIHPDLPLISKSKRKGLPYAQREYLLVFQDRWSQDSRETKSLNIDSKEKDELRTQMTQILALPVYSVELGALLGWFPRVVQYVYH